MAVRPKRILIVDDDEELGTLLQHALRELGPNYGILLARDADEALAKVSRGQFDLVITDIKMPGLSGLQLLEILQKVAPGVPTIAMTAYGTDEIEEQAINLNVVRYLTKPFTIEEFRQAVIEVLKPEEGSSSRKKEKRAPKPQFREQDLEPIRERLAALRTMIGANTVLVINTEGFVIAMDSFDPNLKAENLSSVLIPAWEGVGDALTSMLREETQIKQCFFGSPTYSLCAYALNEEYILLIIFGPTVKEGQVWYYMKDSAKAILNAIQAASPSSQSSTSEPTAESTSPPEDLPDLDLPLDNLEEIDPSLWDQSLAEEAAGDVFGGLSLEEAVKQGFLDPSVLGSEENEE